MKGRAPGPGLDRSFHAQDIHNHPLPHPPSALPPAGDFGSTAFQGALVHDMRYLASVVTQTFSACGDLLSMPNKLAQISGG